MIKLLVLTVFFVLLTTTFAKSDSQYLIDEMEGLRDSLNLEDPARIDLTLRLADLYFDVSIAEGKSQGKEQDQKMLKQNRLKALDLYKYTLSGTDGIKKATGLRRIKIEFQMARLLSRLNEHESAEQYYLSVFSNEKTPLKMREQASLGLAEWFEEDARYTKSRNFYDEALSLCKSKSICNYVHYRKAWLYYKDTKLDSAIAEMKLSLFDEKGDVRENSLTDLMLFMSNEEGNGKASLAYIKGLANKIKRPELVRNLVEAYYVAGNRYAGSHLLADLNKTDGNLYYEVRLLEEFYGFRKWDKVENYLSLIEKRQIKDIPTKKTESAEVLKILRRFVVQVDSEVQVIQELSIFLKRSIAIYLNLYPNDKLRRKMQQGWLKAEEDERTKVSQLGIWIKEDISFGKDLKHIRNLRQTRLSMAQKLKLSDIVIEEALAITEILKDRDEADEFRYAAARELYTQKNYDQALPHFKVLVDKSIAMKAFSKWSLLSQNLSLDIYNQRKDFSTIASQVKAWQVASAGTKDKAILKERASMSKILVQAEFEQATKMGESTESLEKFFAFCFQNVFPEKSCVNAKVLAVKLKDQDKVIRLLERSGDEKALMVEFELMGRFSDAAKLNEKYYLSKQARRKNKGAAVDHYMKTALLYELDQNYKSRDRILKRLIIKIKNEKKLLTDNPKYEQAIFLTLDEANLIDATSLSIPWSLKRKLRLSNRLQMEKPRLKTSKILLSQKTSQGSAWSKLVLSKLKRPFEKTGKISFYGRYSQSRFKKRTRVIDQFVKSSKEYLDGADVETRIYILDMLTAVYVKMTNDILGTPLPEGLDEETLKTVQAQLATMAGPFQKVASDYRNLLESQKIELSEGDKQRVLGHLASEEESKDYASFIQMDVAEKRNYASIDYSEIMPLRATLLKQPESRETLNKLNEFYKAKASARIAAYYKGRVNNLASQEGTQL
jgi:hypothetical protein